MGALKHTRLALERSNFVERSNGQEMSGTERATGRRRTQRRRRPPACGSADLLGRVRGPGLGPPAGARPGARRDARRGPGRDRVGPDGFLPADPEARSALLTRRAGRGRRLRPGRPARPGRYAPRGTSSGRSPARRRPDARGWRPPPGLATATTRPALTDEGAVRTLLANLDRIGADGEERGLTASTRTSARSWRGPGEVEPRPGRVADQRSASTPATCSSAAPTRSRSPATTAERVVHVHLKDVDARSPPAYRAGELDLHRRRRAPGCSARSAQGDVAHRRRRSPRSTRHGYDGLLRARAGRRRSTASRPPVRARRPTSAASVAFLRPGGPAVVPRARRRIGAGVIGFGWLGQRAQPARSLRIPTAVRGPRATSPMLVDLRGHRRRRRPRAAVDAFGFARGERPTGGAWSSDPDVDVVWHHRPEPAPRSSSIEAAAQAGKHVLLREAGRRHAGGDGARGGARWRAPGSSAASASTTAGRRSSSHARRADRRRRARRADQRTAAASSRRTAPIRWASLSWRYRLDEGGHGASSDLLSHAVDLAHIPRRPDRARGRHDRDVHPTERPLGAGAPTTAAGSADDPRGDGHQRGLRRPAVRVRERRARQLRGEPRDRRAGEPAGVRRPRHRAAPSRWDFERDERAARVPPTDDRARLHARVLGGERFPPHGVFVPGSANGIGYEDLVTIEDAAFCDAIAAGRPFAPGFDAALAWAAVQDALLRSGRLRPLGGRVSVTAVGTAADRRDRRRPDRPPARRAARAPRPRRRGRRRVRRARRRRRCDRRRARGAHRGDRRRAASPDADVGRRSAPAPTRTPTCWSPPP